MTRALRACGLGAVAAFFALAPGIARAQPNEAHERAERLSRQWQRIDGDSDLLHDPARLVRTLTEFLEHDSTPEGRAVARAIEQGQLRVVLESFANEKWHASYDTGPEHAPKVVLRPSGGTRLGAPWNFTSLAVELMLRGSEALLGEEDPLRLRAERRITDGEFARRMMCELAETVRFARRKETPIQALPRAQSLLDELLASPSPTAEHMFEILDRRFGVRAGLDRAQEEKAEAAARDVFERARHEDVRETLEATSATLDAQLDALARVRASLGELARDLRRLGSSGNVERGFERPRSVGLTAVITVRVGEARDGARRVDER